MRHGIMEYMLRGLKGLYHLLSAILATLWFRFPSRSLTVIGVTGTDGKTTTTTLIYEILKAAGCKVSMISSVHAVIAGHTYDTGFHVTTPGPFWIQKHLREAADYGDTHMVLEATSHGLSQHRLFGVNFRVGVITNISHEHLDWHGSFEHYLTSKLSLLRRSGIAVINRDEEELFRRAQPFVEGKTVVTYALVKNAHVTPRTYPFTTGLLGDFNYANILAALAATVAALNIDKNTAMQTISTFPGVSGRLEIVTKSPFCVIIDFAHTPNAIFHALKTVKNMTKGRLIHVFGSAGLRDRTKRPLMGASSAKFADIIVLTEEDYRTESVHAIMDDIASGIPQGIEVLRYENRARAIDASFEKARPGDTVIITGKSHEKSLARGTIEYPWDEQAQVRKSLRKRVSTRN